MSPSSNRTQPWLPAILMLALAALACNLPGGQTPPEVESTQAPVVQATQPPQPSQTSIPPTETPQPDVDFAAISFSFDDVLASDVKEEIVPASQYEDAPFWDIYPEYRTYSFEDYLLPERFHKPVISVYPSAEYLRVNPEIAKEITALKDFLSECPGAPESIPFLPAWNAAQMMQAKVKCLEFGNGRGVRFLSQYGQAASPINNHDMFYTFQGLTSDDAYVISIVLPISHPSLPADGNNPPGGDWEVFSENFVSYIGELEQTLNQQPEDSFQPAINLLDEMVASILIKE